MRKLDVWGNDEESVPIRHRTEEQAISRRVRIKVGAIHFHSDILPATTYWKSMITKANASRESPAYYPCLSYGLTTSTSHGVS